MNLIFFFVLFDELSLKLMTLPHEGGFQPTEQDALGYATDLAEYR